METNSQGGFPLTRHSLILAAQGDDAIARSRAIDAITAVYWKPIYKYARLKWNLSSEDAADFTQEFFTRLLEKSSSTPTKAPKDACALSCAHAPTACS